MKLIKIFTFCFFNSYILNGQITVLNCQTNEPIEYCTILNLTKQTGLYTDENGKALFHFDEKDSVKISSIGFTAKYFIYKNLPNKICLETESYVLNEVIIKNSNKKEITLNSSKKLSNIGLSFSSEYAFLVKELNEFPFNVKTVQIPIKYIGDMDKSGVLQLTLREVTENGHPGNLINKPVYLKFYKNIAKNENDLTDFYLPNIPFFVCFKRLNTEQEFKISSKMNEYKNTLSLNPFFKLGRPNNDNGFIKFSNKAEWILVTPKQYNTKLVFTFIGY